MQYIEGSVFFLKIELVLRKEDFTERDVNETKVVVVLDILLATSTIVTCLVARAEAIYPVINKNEAFEMVKELKRCGINETDIYLAGEENAMMIDGFLNPTPLSLRNNIKNKHLILLSTNGTVAIRKASKAKTVFITSLLNTDAIARKILKDYESADITVICSGSNGKYCLEDFYGAGYFIKKLTTLQKNQRIFLSDSSLTAQLFYESFADKSKEILYQSSVGKLLLRLGLQSDIDFISKKDFYNIAPIFSENKIV